MRILLVEDDALLGKATRTGLELEGHAVDWVRDGRAAEQAARLHAYGAIVLDIGLPEVDGMTVLRRLRARGHAGPVLVITARDQLGERIAGLDAGADDFIVKPFDLDELSARIRACARRGLGRARGHIVHGSLVIDPAARTASLDGKAIALTPREFAVLLDLLEHRGQVRTRAQLEEALYGWGDEVASNSVEVHVHHLRRKLGRARIETVHGTGYRIAESAEPTDAADPVTDPGEPDHG